MANLMVIQGIQTRLDELAETLQSNSSGDIKYLQDAVIELVDCVRVLSQQICNTVWRIGG